MVLKYIYINFARNDLSNLKDQKSFQIKLLILSDNDNIVQNEQKINPQSNKSQVHYHSLI